VITYGSFEFKMLQLLEDIYVCAVVAIWQWKLIVVASSMRVVISKLNANLEVSIAIFLFETPTGDVFLAARAYASSFDLGGTRSFTN
jgi:hypothetical protein